MIQIQMEAPSSSLLPPAGIEQVVERAEGPSIPAFGAIHHWGCLYPTWGQNPVEQVLRWEGGGADVELPLRALAPEGGLALWPEGVAENVGES